MIYSEVFLPAIAQHAVSRSLTVKINPGVNQSSGDIMQDWISSSPLAVFAQSGVSGLRSVFTQTTEHMFNEGTPNRTLDVWC